MVRAVFALLIIVSIQAAHAETTNKILNGEFTHGLKGWTFHGEFAPSTENDAFESDVAAAGEPWTTNLSHGVALKPDTDYTLRFDAKSVVERELIVGWGIFHEPWSANVEIVTLSTDWQTYEIKGQATFGADENSRLIFDYGHQLGAVFIDNVSFSAAADPAASEIPSLIVGPENPASVETTPSIVPGASNGLNKFSRDSEVEAVVNNFVLSLLGFSWFNEAGGKVVACDMPPRVCDASALVSSVSESSLAHAPSQGSANSAETLTSNSASSSASESGVISLPMPPEVQELNSDANDSSNSSPALDSIPDVTEVSFEKREDEPERTNAPAPASSMLYVQATAPLLDVVQEYSMELASAPKSRVNIHGQRATSKQSGVDRQAPSRPQNLIVQNATATTVYLKWSPSTDNVAVSEYEIYQDGFFIASTDRQGLNIEFLEQNTEYQFYIKAIDAAGNVSRTSAVVDATTAEDDAVDIFPWASNDHANDGAMSLSSVTMQGGTVLETGNAFDEIKTTDVFSYEGENAIEMNVRHDGTGFAAAHLTTNSDQPGYEPNTTEQRDAPKDVSARTHLRFYVKGDVNSGAFIALADTSGTRSELVHLRDFVAVDSQWQEARIALSEFGTAIDLRSLVSIDVIVNDAIAQGGWTFYIDKVEFINLPVNPNIAIVESLCGENAPDSDADSICDQAEVHFGTDIMNADTDGDRLSDAAELLGVAGVDLWRLGANPLRADIFLEMDYYADLRLEKEAIQIVIDAFANAPTTNPDGSTGITLHVDESDAISGADVDSDLDPVYSDFEVLKNKYFTPERVGIFRYCLVANQYNGGKSSGLAFGMPASEFILTMGAWNTPGGTTLQQAGTLMHELGHVLGLDHGGQDGTNYKTNYFSVMNYHYQLTGLPMRDGSVVFDFSRYYVSEIGTSFNEFDSMSGFNGTTEEDLDKFWVKLREGDTTYHLEGSAASNLDYNRNSKIESTAASIYTPASQSDWDNIVFSGNPASPIGDQHLGLQTPTFTKMSFEIDAEYEHAECLTEDHASH